MEMLQMNTMELEACIQELALNNPMVEPEDCPVSAPESEPDSIVLEKLRWLEENDHQNRFYQHLESAELDPIARASTDGGLEETLFRFISRQLYPLNLSEAEEQTVRYLAACLDDDGYLRVPLEDLAVSSGIPLEQLTRGLTVLRSLEPAGVGAENLSQCLLLQLERIHDQTAATDVVKECLELLARRHYRAIASQLSIPLSAVMTAEKTIRELEPRPGAVFQRPEQPPYILPDIFVEREGNGWQIRTRRGDRPFFHISPYYRQLLEESDDPEVKAYLTEKLQQAEGVLVALLQRDNTLLRCAQVIVERQSAFFQRGPQALVPLRQYDLAEELGLHESTVSRAIRDKYIQCSQGVYPMSYFFTHSAVCDPDTEVGATAARTLLSDLIARENRSSPMTDQQLSDLMAQEGCPISRRTVAKYREMLNIPIASARRVR